ncbi:MAG: hypothetical protein K940chlam6_00737 [Chlamydiae bacterium]|nr:hypothetical protein [Chlamydiota bacterium]
MNVIIGNAPRTNIDISELPAGVEGDSRLILANAVAKIVNHSKFDSPPSARDWFNDPANEEQFASIKQLDLSGKNLKVLPSEIEKLAGLVKLNLNRNSLNTLPEACSKLATNLKVLFARDNKFETRPEVMKYFRLSKEDFEDNLAPIGYMGSSSKFERF